MNDKVPKAAGSGQRAEAREAAYAGLRLQLLAGRFTPGESVTVSLLANMLGAGLMPVREAVQRLVAEGALEILPTGRIRVASITEKEFEELKLIRLRLEGLAGHLAAQNATKENILLINKAYLDLKAAVEERSSAQRVIDANYHFHFQVYHASGAQQLVSMIDRLWLRVSPLLSIPFRSGEAAQSRYVRQNEEAHSRLIGALELRDGPGVDAAIREIILVSAAWFHHFHRFEASDAGD